MSKKIKKVFPKLALASPLLPITMVISCNDTTDTKHNEPKNPGSGTTQTEPVKENPNPVITPIAELPGNNDDKNKSENPPKNNAKVSDPEKINDKNKSENPSNSQPKDDNKTQTVQKEDKTTSDSKDNDKAPENGSVDQKNENPELNSNSDKTKDDSQNPDTATTNPKVQTQDSEVVFDRKFQVLHVSKEEEKQILDDQFNKIDKTKDNNSTVEGQDNSTSEPVEPKKPQIPLTKEQKEILNEQYLKQDLSNTSTTIGNVEPVVFDRKFKKLDVTKEKEKEIVDEQIKNIDKTKDNNSVVEGQDNNNNNSESEKPKTPQIPLTSEQKQQLSDQLKNQDPKNTWTTIGDDSSQSFNRKFTKLDVTKKEEKQILDDQLNKIDKTKDNNSTVEGQDNSTSEPSEPKKPQVELTADQKQKLHDQLENQDPDNTWTTIGDEIPKQFDRKFNVISVSKEQEDKELKEQAAKSQDSEIDIVDDSEPKDTPVEEPKANKDKQQEQPKVELKKSNDYKVIELTKAQEDEQLSKQQQNAEENEIEIDLD
ncbi:hypothetical protein [Mycoplasma sp. Z386]